MFHKYKIKYICVCVCEREREGECNAYPNPHQTTKKILGRYKHALGFNIQQQLFQS